MGWELSVEGALTSAIWWALGWMSSLYALVVSLLFRLTLLCAEETNLLDNTRSGGEWEERCGQYQIWR